MSRNSGRMRPIQVRCVSQTVGSSAYQLEASSRKFDQTIAPGQLVDFRYWASGTATPHIHPELLCHLSEQRLGRDRSSRQRCADPHNHPRL